MNRIASSSIRQRRLFRGSCSWRESMARATRFKPFLSRNDQGEAREKPLRWLETESLSADAAARPRRRSSHRLHRVLQHTQARYRCWRCWWPTRKRKAFSAVCWTRIGDTVCLATGTNGPALRCLDRKLDNEIRKSACGEANKRPQDCKRRGGRSARTVPRAPDFRARAASTAFNDNASSTMGLAT